MTHSVAECAHAVQMMRVEVVWNKGIAALCDWRFPDEFSDGVHYSPNAEFAGALASRLLPANLISRHALDAQIRDGDVVWVRLSWLKSFVREVLPNVQNRFTLVTGDSDSCVPGELKYLAAKILASRYVSSWYTQNYDGSIPSDRISAIPIGVDFHMASEKPIWGEQVTSPEEQERLLLATSRSLPGLADRQRKVYVDFGWQRRRSLRHYRRYVPLQGTGFHESRFRLTALLKDNPAVHFQNGAVSRTEMWRLRGQYAFVLSPHGMGLDCHRTWEALALGHIVLVPSSSLNALFRDLPVVCLSSWADITQDNLERWLERYAGFDGSDERLTSRYWVNKMRTASLPSPAGVAIDSEERGARA